MILLFANNAGSTLASGLPASGAGSTTVVLATGTGVLFPNPGAGQAFKLTLVDAATETLFEICLCTAVSTDTLTVLRGQEGTTARAWNVGDLANNFNTAGAAAAAVQADQHQLGTYDIPTIGGTAGVITGTLTSALTALTNGMKVRFLSPGPSTGGATFNLTLGATATGAITIFQADPGVSGGISAANGALPVAGYPVELTYSATINSGSPGWLLGAVAAPALQPRAMALFAGGTLANSQNIATWTRASAGVYNFTFATNLGSAAWGITWGADGAVATALASASNKLNSGGTINGFDTNTGAAKDVDGTVVFWSA